MFPPPPPEDHDAVNNAHAVADDDSGDDDDAVMAEVVDNVEEDANAAPLAAEAVDMDVAMADEAGVTNAPAAALQPDVSHGLVEVTSAQEAQSGGPFPNNGVVDGQMLVEEQQTYQQPAQPPLGRNASAGDTQPRLGSRQDSVGIQPPFSADDAQALPIATQQQQQPSAFEPSAPVMDATNNQKSVNGSNLAVAHVDSPPANTLALASDPHDNATMQVDEAVPSSAATTESPTINQSVPKATASEAVQPVEAPQDSVAEQPIPDALSAGNAPATASDSDTAAAVVLGDSSQISRIEAPNSSPAAAPMETSSTTEPPLPPEIRIAPETQESGNAAGLLKMEEVAPMEIDATDPPQNPTDQKSTEESSPPQAVAVESETATTPSFPGNTSSVPSKEDTINTAEEKTEGSTSAVDPTVGQTATIKKNDAHEPAPPVETAPSVSSIASPADQNPENVQNPSSQDIQSEEVKAAAPEPPSPALASNFVLQQVDGPSQAVSMKVAAEMPPQPLAAIPPSQNPAVAAFHGGPIGGFGVHAGVPAGIENGGMVHGGPMPGAPPPPRPPGAGPFGGMKELRVEDALLYLDDVKREFGDRPRIYNEFLAIMKNFKSQEVDTPGVIARVSKLFRGYNNLILGFNKFLPDGFKISMEDLRQQDAAYAREQEILRQQQLAMEAKAQQLQLQREQQVVGPPMMGAMGMGLPGSLQQSPQHGVVAPPQQMQLQQQEESPQLKQGPAKLLKQAKGPKGRKPPKGPGTQPAQPQPVQHQAVEFDHAISYVTTIKRRFANDPGTYHAFLEILHTYQKEQRGIKEVLEQVAHLFQDHPDLLKEFTFFLPDAVQEQAKERLHRAAAESESRLSALRAKKQQGVLDGDSQQVIDMTGQPMLVDADARNRKRPFHDVDAPQPISFPQTPESYVYNAAVERQFFDAAKEALASYTRDGGQAWAEFMKCLDMYAQEILSRNEMLNFVEPLLGKRNSKLFEEFKRILAAAGGRGTSTAPPMEDSWYSVPLSEIDFSRCRRCSPSYRALPRDYPAPPCSQRSDEEAKVLNDVWVSLPVGSEESYTFRHMRRNTYEETLFRCEDERFEIDMAIDSNTCTLALLEPFAEELAILSANEVQTQIEDGEAKPGSEQNGLGGKFFQFTFDPSILGVIHRNSIVRIYGDQGSEMLDLLKNNPSVAIPIVVKRLRQKDQEWQRVRERLNRHWKELARQNYYKSLDHRSLTWRTTDKKAISTRTLIAEIKDRASNNGNEGQASLQARIDKAKEEHGSFYEVTMAKSIRSKLDLSNLPKPDRRLFTPHMSFMYEGNSWVQRDAYRILSFALERGSISPTDKERCHRLWTEFLGPWFNIGLNWMLSPAVGFLESSSPKKLSTGLLRTISRDESNPVEDEEESLDDGDSNPNVITEDTRNVGLEEHLESSTYADHHPLPVGSTVSTMYGEGTIVGFREDDGVYEVELPLGNAFLRPSAVLCSILAAEKSAYTTQRRNDDRTKLDRPDDKLVIGTQSLYLFFRLHQILCRRLGIAKKLAYEVKNDESLQTLVEQMPGEDDAALGKRRYDAFLSLVFALLDGGTGSAAEGGKFEDRVRSLLGHGGYELATMDKLISHILKNIQSMANDDTMWTLVQLFRRHADAGDFKPEALRQEAAYLSDGEQMYAFQLCPVYKEGGDKSVLYMEYLGNISGSEEEDDSLSDPAVEQVSKRQKR